MTHRFSFTRMPLLVPRPRRLHRTVSRAVGAAALVAMPGTLHAGASTQPAPPHFMRIPGTMVAAAATGMSYNGGTVQKNPKIFVTFWGFSSDPSGEAPYLQNFLRGLVGTPWINSQNQYWDQYRGYIVNARGAYGGAWFDNLDPVPTQPTQDQIAAEAATSASHFGSDPDAQYIVATPSGHSAAGFGTQWCGWHSSAGSIAYIYFPYNTDVVNCGTNSINAGSAGLLDGVSIVAGHEVAETETDPIPFDGWIGSGGETGDLCAWLSTGPGAMYNASFSTGTFAVQGLWSNRDNSCEDADTTPSGAALQVTVARNPITGSGDLLMRAPDLSAIHATAAPAAGDVAAWNQIGGVVPGAPSATWNATGTQLDAFTIGMDGSVYHDAFTAPGWSGWSKLNGFTSGGNTTKHVTATRRPNGEIDLFARGTDNAAWHGLLDANVNVVEWDSLGGSVLGAPTGTWNATGTRLDVYAIGTDSRIYHDAFTFAGGWSGFQAAPGQGVSGSSEDEAVSSTRRPNDVIDLFVQGGDGAGYHTSTDSAGNPFPWERLGGFVKAAPSGAWSLDGTRLDVYAIGGDNTVYHDVLTTTAATSSWSGWSSLDGGGVTD